MHFAPEGSIGDREQPGERRESKLVFIGRGLPKAAMIGQLERCLVS